MNRKFRDGKTASSQKWECFWLFLNGGVEDEELAELAKKVARMLTKEKAPKNGEFFEA